MLAEEDDAETAFLVANLVAIAITIEDVASAAKDDSAYRETYLALSETNSTHAKTSSCTMTG